MSALLTMLEVVLLVVVIQVAVPQRAYAYVDPSVMTYTIQALAGVAVALSAVAGVAFRRTRKAMMRALGVDDNARKTKDSHCVRITACDEALKMTAEEVLDLAEGACGKSDEGKPSHAQRMTSDDVCDARLGERFLLAIIVSIFAVGTVFFVTPIEVVVGSSTSLTFGLADILPVVSVFVLVLSLVISSVMVACRGRAYWIVLAIIFALGLSAYIQAMFMNVGLPSADGNVVNWSAHDKVAIVSALVWAALISISVVFAVKKPSLTRRVIPAIALVLIIMQGVGVASLIMKSDSDGYGQYSWVATEDGLFDVSGNENIIVFVLDTYDTRDLLRLESIGQLDAGSFDGFVWYTNASGAIMPTRYAIPFLLTGELPNDDDKWSEYLAGRYTRSDFIANLDSAGYSVGLYSADLCLTKMEPTVARKTVCEHTVNLHKQNIGNTNVIGILKGVLRCSLYRDLPWVLKPRFWFTTDWVNTTMTNTGDGAPENTVYTINDAKWYAELQSNGLSICDEQKVFRFIHLNGIHRPYNLDSEGHATADGASTLDEQAIGSLKTVEYYLNELKRLDVYDESTIIITADHGEWWVQDTLKQSSEPILLYKPSYKSSSTYEVFRKDDSEVLHGDIVSTVAKDAGFDSSGYNGVPLGLRSEPIGDRYFLTTIENADMTKDLEIVQWVINGNTLDFANWRKTGKTWNAQE